MPDNVWEANGGTKSYNSGSNWSLNHVPQAGEDVIINGTGSAICDLDVDTAALLSFTMTGSAAKFNNGTNKLTVAGNVSIDTVSVFSGDTGTLELTASGNLSNPNSTNTFYAVTQVGAITTTLTDDVYIGGAFTTSNTGTVTDNGGGTRDLHVDGSLVVGGVTWTSVGTLALWMGIGTTLPGDDYGNINIRIRFTTTGTVTMGGHVTTTNGIIVGGTGNDVTSTLATGGFNLSCADIHLGISGQSTRGGTLSVTGSSILTITAEMHTHADDGTQINGIVIAASGTNAISIGGAWTIDTGGNFDAQESVVTFDGSGAQAVTSGGQSFSNVIIDKSGGTVTLIDAMTCTDDFTLTLGGCNTGGFALGCIDFAMTNGTFTANASIITCSGDCSRTGGTLSPGTSTWDLTGTGNLRNSSLTNPFGLVKCAAISQTTTLIDTCVAKKWEFGTGVLTASGSYDFSVYQPAGGKLITNAGVTINASGGTNPNYHHWYGAGGQGFTYDSVNFGSGNIAIDPGTNTYFDLLGNWTTTGSFTYSAASNGSNFDLNGNNLTCGALVLSGSGSNTQVLYCGEGTVDCTSFATNALAGVTTLNMESCTFECSGDFTIGHVNHTLTPGASMLDLDGASTQDITLNGESFNDVDITGTSIVEMQDAFVCANFTLATGTFDTNSVGDYAMTVTTFDMNGGTFNANGSAIGVGGNCTIDGGTFNKGASTVTLTASGNLSNASVGDEFNNLTQSGGVVTTLTGIARVSGAMIAGAASTIQTDGTSRTFVFDGTLTVNTVTWSGNGATLTLQMRQNMTTIPGDDYGDADITFYRTTTGTATLSGALITTGLLYILPVSTNQTPKVASGGFAITCGLLTIGMDGSNSRGGRLTLSGNSALTVNGATIITEANGSTAWSEIVVSASGTSAIDFNGNLTMRVGAGTGIDAQAASITASGAWLNQGAYFTIGTSTVEFDGTGTQAITSGGAQFNNVTVTNTGGTVTFVDVSSVQGTFAPGDGASAITLRFATTGTHHWEAIDTSAASGTGTIDMNSIGESASWALTIGSAQVVTSVDVTYSNLTGFDIDASDATNVDGGNNSANWNFGAPPAAADYAYAQKFGQLYGQLVGQL